MLDRMGRCDQRINTSTRLTRGLALNNTHERFIRIVFVRLFEEAKKKEVDTEGKQRMKASAVSEYAKYVVC